MSEILLSEVISASYSERMDSQFFLKNYLNHPSFNFPMSLSEIAYIKSGTTPTDRDDELKQGVILLKTNDVRNNLLNKYSSVDYFISKEINNKMLSSQLQSDDILVNIVGATLEVVGRVAYVSDTFPQANITQAMSFVRLKSNYKKELLPTYLFTFLQSSYGKIQISRNARPTGQYNLNNEELGAIKIPFIDMEIQKQIDEVIKQSNAVIQQSVQKYTQAETLLLESLGLQNFQAACNPVNVKLLKESFLQTGRLDAEFYQPLYEQLENHIFTNAGGFAKLGDVCRLNDGNYTPKDNQEYDYIELSNIGKSGEITGSTRALGKELPSRARRRVRSNQVMISSIEGSLQSGAIVPPHYDDAVCSTGFYVLSSNKINAETLLVLFKSPLMQQILKKNCSGTILTAINKEELLNIPVPIIDAKTQTRIADYVRQSNDLRGQAKALLAQAKSDVELEIENISLNINSLQNTGG